jgi:hypothetical protein
VYRSKRTAIGLISFLMLFSLIQTSQAELWEFIVEADVEKNIVYSGDTVVVTGKVVDQAYKSTRGVEILIRAGSETTKAFTNPDGIFRGEFTEFQRIPGTYVVNVIASWYGMTGMTNTQFQVKGDTTAGGAIIEKLSTEEAIKYLSSNESDFEKNPIGQTLFKYYHELHDELIKEKKKANKVDEKQTLLNQQKTVAENLKNNALAKYNPKAGVYDGYQYEQYIHSLNPKIRDMIASQLNFTKNNFADAQNVRDEILEKGGTYEEARQAYLDRISITKEELNEFNEKKSDGMSEENKQLSEEESKSK